MFAVDLLGAVGGISAAGTLLFAVFTYRNERNKEQARIAREAAARIPLTYQELDSYLSLKEFYVISNNITDILLSRIEGTEDKEFVGKALSWENHSDAVMQAALLGYSKSGIQGQVDSSLQKLRADIAIIRSKFPTLGFMLGACEMNLKDAIFASFGGGIFFELLKNYMDDFKTVFTRMIESGSSVQAAYTEAFAMGPYNAIQNNGQEMLDQTQKIVVLSMNFIASTNDAEFEKLSRLDRSFAAKASRTETRSEDLKRGIEVLRKVISDNLYTELTEVRTKIEGMYSD